MERGIDIARAQPDDWQTIRDLRFAALAEAPAAFGSTLPREQLYDEAMWRRLIENAAWFVASDDGHPIGIVAAYVDRAEPTDRALVSLWVEPARRRSGLGRALVLTIIEWSRADAAAGVRLQVAVDNDLAIRLYTSLGFGEAGQLPEVQTERAMRLALVPREGFEPSLGRF